jgi:hypothetical protein
MKPFGVLPAFLSVGMGAWMLFTSGMYRKTLEGKIEVGFPKDRSCTPLSYFKTEDRLHLELWGDGRRWVGGREVGSDEELVAALEAGRHPDLDVPVGVQASRDTSWREVVRTMGLCVKGGFRLEMRERVP